MNTMLKAIMKLGIDDTVYELDHRPTLEEAQQLVKGYVEVFERNDGKQFLMNEEGMFKNMGYNQRATAMAHKEYPEYAEYINFLGPVIVLDGDNKWE